MDRRYQLKSRYGLTPEQYRAILDSQDGLCCICRCPETLIDHRTKRPRRLAVDHRHDTGAVRGLLCAKCNKAIGLLKENPRTLLAACDYLLRHQETP